MCEDAIRDAENCQLLAARRTLLLPSLYSAEWSRTTNFLLSERLCCPFDLTKSEGWPRYHALQSELLSSAHLWLAENLHRVEAVFYTNLFKDFSLSLMVAFPHLRVMGIAHGSSGDPLEPGADGRLVLIERAISKVATVCATSRHLADKLLHAGVSRKCLRVVGLPVDSSAMRRREGKTPGLCVFNHRLVEEKGILTLPDVWESILRGAPRSRCIVTWPWAQAGIETWLLQRTQNVSGIELRGVIPDDEYHNLLDTASVGFSLTRYENFGTAFAYAIMRGVCYFVPDSYSYREVAPVELRYATIAELVQKVQTALTEEEYAAELVDQAQCRLLTEYSLDRVLSRCGIGGTQ